MSSAISSRPTDSDDVKWALHTASTQLDRGSLADAIQWVKRAAQYAEESGDAWRATELKNSARELAERMWTSEPEEDPNSPPSSTIDISVEDVDADDLLEAASVPPAPHDAFHRGQFQSVPPGVVLRQSYPADSAPPEPIPLYPSGELQPKPHALGGAPAAWAAQPGGVPTAASFAAPPVPFQAQPPGFAPATPAASPAGAGGAFASKAPTLQMGSPQEAPGQRPPPPRRRSIRPKAPRSSSNPPPPHRSSAVAGTPGPEVFSSAPPADRFSSIPGQRMPLLTPRVPMGSAPELLVSEVDLEGAAFATSSLLPPPPSNEPELTPEEFERELRAQDNVHVVSSAPFEVDPALADLFAEEEVVEDRDSVDRMSDIVLDPSEFEHQSLIDDQEETHVLTKNVVQSLKEAAQKPPAPAPHESGEHEVMSQSGFPTAPPPGPHAPSEPPVASRPSSADMRRVMPMSSAPPVPFAPAPSSPEASRSAVPAAPSTPAGPTSIHAPASLPAPPSSMAPLSLALPTPPQGASAWPQSEPAGPPSSVGPQSAPGSVRPAATSSSPPSSIAPRTAPPVLVRRSSRAAPPETTVRPGEPTSSAPTVHPQPSMATPLVLMPSSAAPPPVTQPPAPPTPIPRIGVPALPPPAKPALTEPVVDDVSLEDARGFEDLPAEVQLALAASARVERLDAGEEVSFFGAAIVTSGRVDILPAFSEEAGAVADEGDVIFTHGNLETSIDLRVVAKLDDTRVAVWDPETLRNAIAECPWVADELKLIADRYLALCGATLGPLGERLDDSLRATVFQRLEVRVYNEGDVLVEAGKAVPGLLIIGGGRVLVNNTQGQQAGELNMGDFVFASGLLGGAKAPGTAVAAKGGALVLTAPRQVAHELMMSVPPLVEVLAG